MSTRLNLSRSPMCVASFCQRQLACISSHARVKPMRLTTREWVPVSGQVGQKRIETSAFSPALNWPMRVPAEAPLKTTVLGPSSPSALMASCLSTWMRRSPLLSSKVDSLTTRTSVAVTRTWRLVFWYPSLSVPLSESRRHPPPWILVSVQASFSGGAAPSRPTDSAGIHHHTVERIRPAPPRVPSDSATADLHLGPGPWSTPDWRRTLGGGHGGRPSPRASGEPEPGPGAVAPQRQDREGPS